MQSECKVHGEYLEICSALNFFSGMTGSFPSDFLTTLGLKKPGQVKQCSLQRSGSNYA
jgi:hypothetical protein